MRNFSKTLISMAAVMAVGSAMAAGAMAADMAATYDAATGIVTITDAASHGASNTLLVVQGTTAEGSTDVTYNATESTIKQIDQNDADAAFASAVVGTLDDGSYEVRVGGTDGTVQSAVFTVSSEVVEPVVTDVFKVGDITRDNRVLANDTKALAQYKAGMIGTAYKNTTVENQYKLVDKETKVETGETFKIGDITRDGRVLANDTKALAQYKAGMIGTSYKNTTTEDELEGILVVE
jgi:hypothetical protein